MSADVRTALLVNFLFWPGLAIGAVVFAALLELTEAAWALPLRPIAQRFRRFLPIALAIYAIAFAAARTFRWRDAAVLAIAYGVAFWFGRTAERTEQRPGIRVRAAIALLVVYPIAFSIIAVDLVMSLEPAWVSTLFPAYVFTANVYAGIAAVAVAAAIDLPDERIARDLGSVLLGFALIWIYFVWTQFLVIWYGNLPADTSFITARIADGWRSVAFVVLAMRGVLPALALLTRTGRRPIPLAMVGATIVAGFWIECWLLVGPALPGRVTSPAAVAVTAGFALVFATSRARPPGAARGDWWLARFVRGS